MHFNNEDLKEFIEIWKEEFGEELSEDEARQHASRLLQLYLLLATRSDEEPPSPTVELE